MSEGWSGAGRLEPGQKIGVVLNATRRLARYAHTWLVDPTVEWVVATVLYVEPRDEGAVSVALDVGGESYRWETLSTASVKLISPHYPVCSECGEAWPCRDRRINAETVQFAHELADVCNHCGKRINGAWSTSFFDGTARRRYHIAKKYSAGGVRCADAAEAALAARRVSVVEGNTP